MRLSFLGLGCALAAWTLSGCFTDESLVICAGALNCDCKAEEPTCGAGLTCSGNRCIASGSGSSMSADDAQVADETQTSTGDDGSSQSTDDGSSPMDEASVETEASTSSDATSGNPGTNLITNGDFSQGTTLWGTVPAPSLTLNVTGNELCVNASTTLITLAWPQNSTMAALTLSMSATYTLSYMARATQSTLTVDAKVGHTTAPYTADFETPSDSVTTMLQPFTHTFMPPQDDSSTGLAFAFTSSGSQSVCFQSVSLVQN
jgi:hypothetical protein